VVCGGVGNEKARKRGIVRVWTLIDIDTVLRPNARIQEIMRLKEEYFFEAFEV
jgi:hypothetical protein